MGLGRASVQRCVFPGVFIPCKEVVPAVAVSSSLTGKDGGLLCKQVFSALFQLKVSPSR